MLDKLKTAFVLVVIGAVSGFLIFGANKLTFQAIIDNRIAREQALYNELFDKDESFKLQDELEITELDGIITQEIVMVDADGNLLGYIYKGEDTNTYGDVTVLVGVDAFGTITNVVISSTGNTPNYYKIITQGDGEYLIHFSGQSVDSITYDSNTGATFTYGSVSKIVDAASIYYSTNRGVE